MSRGLFKYFIFGVFTGAVVLAALLYFREPKSGENGTPELEVTPVAAAQIVPDDAVENSRRNAITNAIEIAAPAVVGINVTGVKQYIYRSPFANDPLFRDFFPDRIYREKVHNLGSGFIISPDGYIITNEHVVQNALEIIVTMSDGSQHSAEIVGKDHLIDVALLKIRGQDHPYLKWFDSNDVIIGEWAIAIGNPFGLFSNNAHPTVTVGVISAVDRDFDRNNEGRLYQDMIQTDASINPGNSGGPLLNSNGSVIGMNTMIFSGGGGSIGLGFAIPSAKIREVVEALKTEGAIDRNYWIGISIQDVNQLISMALGMKEVKGVVVTDLEDGSPAEKAGIKVADVIVGINGYEIRDTQSVQSILNNEDLKVNDDIILQVLRSGSAENVKLTLQPLPQR